MRFLLRLIGLLLVFGQTDCIHAQFYVTGEAPASMKWEEIKTESFKVVFPSGMFEQANRFANLLEYYKQRTTDLTLNSKRKMPVIMQGMSVLSNGYVAWAPKRIEIVPVPPQDSYAQDWLSQLAVHEFRHVIQISNLKKGFTRGLSVFTGQIATGISSAMVPAWLYEGDAVLHETRLSNTGRGRSPGFEMPLRTLVLENEIPFSYDKAIFGSFRDFVPDHYQYGYQIAGYADARYGSNIWADAFEYTGKNMFLITPLAFYLKKNFGINKSRLYHQTIDSIKYLYNKQKEDVTYTDFSTLSKRNGSAYTNYILPQFVDNEHITFLKTSINHLDKLVMLDSTGNEQILTITGITQGIALSASANYVVWDEQVRDIRWGKRSYSEIRILELHTGRIKSLTKRTRYFSPDIDSKEKYVVAVETGVYNQNGLVILDVATGEAIKLISAPNNEALQTPRWNKDKIIVVTVAEEGKTIAEADPESGQWETLLANTLYNVSEPLGFKDYVIFRSNFNGLEDLFAINRNTRQIYQITSSRYGAYHPAISPDSSRIVYSEYTVKGFDMVEMSLDTILWRAVTIELAPSGIWFSKESQSVSTFSDHESDNAGYRYNTQPYRKILNTFRFHSWLPFYSNVSEMSSLEDMQIYTGFMLFSQNLLETAISTIGYAYTNGSHILKPAFIWSGWYPVFEISGQFGHYKNGALATEEQDFQSRISPHNSYELKAYVPMVFTRGKSVRIIQPYIEYQHTGGAFGTGENEVHGLDYLHTRLYLSVYKRLSFRDLYPRLGSEFTFNYTYTPLNRSQLGDMYSLATNLYFPGIGAHHHFFVYAGLQEQLTREYYLPINQIKFPRGYPASVSKFYGSVALNYAFPVFYPDWSVNSVLYVKRLRADLFFDYGYGIDIYKKTSDGIVQTTGNSYSFGTELMLDFHPLRFIFPVSAGIRTGYLPLTDEVFTDFLIRVSTSLLFYNQ